jgi:galactonate dehydratase
VGWGEAQAPVAPEVACAIVDHILTAALADEQFDGTLADIERLRWKMYSAMRVRGQTGGFMLDAIAGIDIALWDLAGKLSGVSISHLLRTTRPSIPAYQSGVPNGDLDIVRRAKDSGISDIKIYYDNDESSLWRTLDSVSAIAGQGQVAVDALWRLTRESAPAVGRELDRRRALFLECPLMPENAVAHGELARSIDTPIALGESYRTRFELSPFFEAKAMRYVQPDLGRTGITEALAIADRSRQLELTIVPHVSIAMGPQIAAAIHFAAATPNCPMLEYNPAILATANRFLAQPLRCVDGKYQVPSGPGLGIELTDLPR